MKTLIAFLLVAMMMTPLAAQKSALTIVAIDGHETSFTLEQLSKRAQRSVEVINNHTGAVERYEGVLLGDLLQEAGAPNVAKNEGKELRDYVVMEAADGYKVVFSLAELQPEFQRGDGAIIALSFNGKALGEKRAPLQLVLPQDKRLTRGVRMLAKIRIVRAE